MGGLEKPVVFAFGGNRHDLLQEAEHANRRGVALERSGPMSGFAGGYDVEHVTLPGEGEVFVPGVCEGGLDMGSSGRRDSNLGFAVVDDDVKALTTSDIEEFDVSLDPRTSHFHIRDTLLCVVEWPAGVGRDAVGRRLLGLNVAVDALEAALLVAPENGAHSGGHVRQTFLDRPHCVERSDRRPLIVDSPAAIDVPVVDLCAEGLVLPTRADGHDVEVAKAHDEPITFAEFCISAVSFEVLGPHTPCGAQAEHVVKSLTVFLSERRPGLRFGLDGREPKEGAEGVEHLRLVIIDPGLQGGDGGFWHGGIVAPRTAGTALRRTGPPPGGGPKADL